MKQQLVKASTDVTLIVFIQDSSSTTGAGLTGLVYNSASLVCYYVRPGSAAAALSLATQTVTGAHADGGFVEIDATNMPGLYRLDLSDAVVATGVDSVAVMLKGATNMAPVTLEIQLTDVDLNDGVRGGMTALPDAAADAAGGLIISDAGGFDVDTQLGADIDAILVDTNSLNDTKIPQTLNLTASGNIGIDWANVENPTTAVDLSGTDIQLCDTVTTLTNDPAIVASGTADSGTTTTLVDAALTEADTDYWEGNLLKITSGNIAGQVRYIRAFTPGTDTLTVFPAFTQAVSTNTYEILPCADFLRGILIDVDDEYSAQEAMSLMLAALAGVTTTSGSVLQTPDGSATRITATLNASNERTAMSTNPSA